MDCVYPFFLAELGRRGIKKCAVADSLGICSKTLNEKIKGKTPFTYPEVIKIRDRFFPDLAIETLFSTEGG